MFYHILIKTFSSVSGGSTGKRNKSQGRSGNSTPTEQKLSQQMQEQLNLGTNEVPKGVCDFDKENWDDIFQVSHYAMDIFNYLKSREVSYGFLCQ